MTRRTFWAILAAPAFVLAWLCLLDPALFLWGLAVVAVLVVLGAVTAAVVVGREVVDLRANLADSEERAEVLADALAEANALAEESQRLAAQVMTHAEREHVKYLSLSELHRRCRTPRIAENVVPFQRGGERDRLAMSSEEWDAIVRETEGPA